MNSKARAIPPRTDLRDKEAMRDGRIVSTAEPRLALASSHELDDVPISTRSRMLLKRLLLENPDLATILEQAETSQEAREAMHDLAMEHLAEHDDALRFYRYEASGREVFERLTWQDLAAIRLLDYVDNAGREFNDPTLRGGLVITDPVRVLWLAYTKRQGGAQHYFFQDWIMLMRQLKGKLVRELPTRARIEEWMARWPTGLEPAVVRIREQNKERILRILIRKLRAGELQSNRFSVDENLSEEQQLQVARDVWWNDHRFHLSMAVRNPRMLNAMLGHSLHPSILEVLHAAAGQGIPFFVNPYYLSLINVTVPPFAIGADLAIRNYVLYTKQLVEEFGNIVAWEMEDRVEPGKPNAAGWLLPSHHSVHRRYPEVAILIPETTGRACGGLCTSCQRMYDFQSGRLNFELDRLHPNEKWPDRLRRFMDYFEHDTQLRDILVTGGDALMSSDESMKQILDAIHDMAARKRAANEQRPDGRKFAEIVRVRLGTRLPAYLPMRITEDLCAILADFKQRASEIGISQFVIQTHIESPMEITPELARAVRRLTAAGWMVTNQFVFTAAASCRGHTAKLRRALGEVGIVPYYTFSVKGYMENQHSFATNARAMQEQIEEKYIGVAPEEHKDDIRSFAERAEHLVDDIAALRATADLPFLATDRNVLNLPGVGKSLTYRTIGITRYGRRILEFEHDHTRRHSPIINKMDKVIVIESKSVTAYLEQLAEWGEEPSEYESIYGYSIGETEPREAIFEYPPYDFSVSKKMSNLDPSISS